MSEMEGRQAPRSRIAEGVHSYLRAKIANGEIRPNEMLIEIEIAEELGVSRSPIREALQRLVSDGLVDLVRRRWIVHEFTESEIVEIYEVRAALERHAAKLAASAILPDQREELLGFREEFERHMQDGLVARVYKNNEFHDAVIRCSNNQRLIRFATMNNTYHFNFNLASLYSAGNLLHSAQQHIELIDAIIAGEGDRAAVIAEQHVCESLELIQEKIFATDTRPRSTRVHR